MLIPHLFEEGRTVAFAVEHQHKPMPVPIAVKFFLSRLSRHVLQQLRHDVVLDRFQHALIERPLNDEERLAQAVVDPFFGSFVGTQLGQLVPQATDFGHAVQSQQLSQLARRMVLQLLDRFDPAQRHEAQQGKDLQRSVLTTQRLKAAIEMPEESVLFEGGQGTQHTAERDVATVFVSRGRDDDNRFHER